ncbi:MAG: hypothetical protein CVV44_01465 [Spirochaetae bacterium HGW-Spirochaetae-1]|jgi:hypothetical protein|nr:MAG: hypothetical protein CVV44_01465 [Spirochaetae bacterium HGW-Spirochaetae-1]
MKIASDVRDGAALPVRSGNPSRNNMPQGGPVSKSTQDRLFDHQVQQSILARLAMERSMGDALSIAQVSQSLIQKAIIISAQLRNIASQAMIEGKIDQAALSQAVSEIPGDVQREEPAVAAQLQRVINIPAAEMGRINAAGEIEEMRKIGEAMTLGTIPSVVGFDALDGRLQGKSRGAGEIISKLQEMMGKTLAEYPSGTEGVMTPVSARTAQNIVEYPKTALIAQGNLAREAVNTILD